MRFLVAFVFSLLLITGNAFAGFQAFNGSTNLGVFSKLKCSTGLTCTNAGSGVFQAVSSPTLASALTLSGAEATAAILTLQADESDDSGDDFRLQVSTSDVFEIANDTSGSQVTKWSLTTAGNVSMVGSLAGDGGDALYGFLNNTVAATATTITAAQCGSTFINSGAVEMELPEASTVIGCRLTFITANAANFDVDPDAADQILVQTNAAGDMIRNATLGNAITIQAINASQWAPVSVQGTWSDAN